MHKCKSGQHLWLFKEDADKCCNGFRRVLVINPSHASGGHVSYGYRWEPV